MQGAISLICPYSIKMCFMSLLQKMSEVFNIRTHFSKPKPTMLKSAWLLPFESTYTVQEQKNSAMGVHNTAHSTDACPDSHSSLTDYWLWIKPFLFFVNPGCFHQYITYCESPPFHIISIPAGNYFCNYQMLQIHSDI